MYEYDFGLCFGYIVGLTFQCVNNELALDCLGSLGLGLVRGGSRDPPPDPPPWLRACQTDGRTDIRIRPTVVRALRSIAR